METSNGMNKSWLIVIGVALLIFIAGIAQFFFAVPTISPPTPTATSTAGQNTDVTTTDSSLVDVKIVPEDKMAHPLPLAKGDNIASWEFKGAYTGNDDLIMKARDEIKRLSDILATATSSAMIISVGIANQYELMGDGEKQYEYLGRAIRTDDKSGLPWHNLGVLMERLGAYETARIAYEKSTIAQPELRFYHYAYIEFLVSRMKSDTANIEKSFSFAKENIGETPYLDELRAQWQKP